MNPSQAHGSGEPERRPMSTLAPLVDAALSAPLAMATGGGAAAAGRRFPASWLQRRGVCAPAPPMIEGEAVWRQPESLATRQPSHKIAVSRWVSLGDGRREVACGPASGHHLVAVALRQMQAELSVGGRLVHRGRVMPGMHHVTPPGDPAHAVFHGGFDALHVHLPEAVVQECRDATATGRKAKLDQSLRHDPLVERLARALLHAGDGAGGDSLHVELVCLALMTRLLSCQDAVQRAGRGPSPLPSWRLARVIGFIDANLDTTIGLADLAQAAGLTRMHFAAQFRAATGVRPHDYVQQRRVERAQALLATSRLPLVQVALSTGFQTQSHFSTVFKRLAGNTPNAWRRAFLGTDEAILDLTTPPNDTPLERVAEHLRDNPSVERTTV